MTAPAVRRIPPEQWPRSIRRQLGNVVNAGACVAVLDVDGTLAVVVAMSPEKLDANIAALIARREARAA